MFFQFNRKSLHFYADQLAGFIPWSGETQSAGLSFSSMIPRIMPKSDRIMHKNAIISIFRACPRLGDAELNKGVRG